MRLPELQGCLIREMLMDRGAVVKQGQVLAQREAAEEDAELTIAQAREVFPLIGRSRVAYVAMFNRVFDAASATVVVQLELRSPGDEIPPGMICPVRFAGVG